MSTVRRSRAAWAGLPLAWRVLAGVAAWACVLAHAAGAPPPCPREQPVTRWDGCIGTLDNRAGGSLYTGEFRRGQPHGHGVMHIGTMVYAGEFSEGLFEGQGMLVIEGGRRYLGGFRRGAMEGLGRILDPQGRLLQEGTYRENQLVQAAAPAAPAAPTVAPPMAAAPPPTPAAPPPMVAAAPPVPATPAPAAGAAKAVLRDGVYLRTQFFGSSLSTTVYQVLGDRIAEGPRKVLGPGEFTRDSAAKVGSFRVQGDRILIRWQGEDQEVNNAINTTGNCPNFMGGIVCPVATFRDGERITGTFVGGASAGNVSSSVRLQLNADGSYQLTTRGGVNTPGGSAMSEGVEQGRYQLSSASTMRLMPARGEPREVLVFPFPAQDSTYLWFGSQMLQGKVVRQ